MDVCAWGFGVCVSVCVPAMQTMMAVPNCNVENCKTVEVHCCVSQCRPVRYQHMRVVG